MATSDDLSGFVKDVLARGQSRDSVRDVLLKAGWSADQVNGALASFADVEFPVPVPKPTPYVSAKEAFLYLLMFAMLYTAAFNLASLIFNLINLAMPDPAMAPRDQFTRVAIRWSASAVIVSFPVFVYLAVLAARSVRRDPTKRASKVRRWVTYLTLLIAATALICDVTVLVYDLLGGEQTTRGLLKFLTVGVIAGAAFSYYLSDLRVDEKDDRNDKEARP
jgi:succinate dehydrogenase hydrophobic anchor subunit